MAQSRASARGPLAVFDVDGTLFRRGLLPALTRRLVNEGVFSERVREELSEDYYAWVERRGSYDTYDRLVMDLFLRELAGVSVAELRRCARIEVQTHGRRVDRKSTRLNSSHANISYAVFCLKKKNADDYIVNAH